ncbi:MAG: class I SAM-dependent methyltransferase, partial [Phycisphaerae bacterium]|nr:class I SAM-dependent methyltransferase [Phycisphaerae bacterium]MDW8263309.1 class I SAM-dependent methyltransferase [Phycisphaerales bacterium]
PSQSLLKFLERRRPGFCGLVPIASLHDRKDIATVGDGQRVAVRLQTSIIAGMPGRDRSRRYHDRVARRYDAIYDDPYWHFHDELAWRAIKPHLPRDPTAPCADLGCGTGKWGLKLLKSGFPVTFVDSSAAMIEQTRAKLAALGAKARRARLLVGDIVHLADLPENTFALLLAMGDPLSICRDPGSAVREMFRICAPGGIVIATADNKLAALDHFVQRGNLDMLEQFIRTGRTHWLTPDPREQFELTMFTPASLRNLFERSGFSVVQVAGLPILPARNNRRLLEQPDALNRLLQMESELARDPASAGRASHLRITARKPEP